MGFYGNITNTARTQFQFDKVYPNRYEMEQKTKTDGIYAGRYILIEYDSDIHLDHMLRVWHMADGWYTQDNNDVNILLKEGNVTVGELVYTASAEVDRNDPRAYKNCVFYKCIGFNNDANKTAKFEEVVDGSSDPNTPAYTINYNIDTDVFGAGRGYDSTVWQKTYSAEAGEKYVMIAELNTVVPTFDVTPDAPTMNPVVPHFDTQSTDVYYKLHWQAPWGFRVKATDASKSDETTTHTITTYDPETGKNTTSATSDIPAAIYYNDAGFAAQVDTSRKSTEGINKHSTTVTEDEIKIEPTGKSGNKYNDHEGQSTQSEQVDIQEMTINLPSIGNMMSDAWDIIHGPLRNDDMREFELNEDGSKKLDKNGKPIRIDSLQGRLDSIAALGVDEIPLKRDSDGRLIGSKVNGGKIPDQMIDLTGINDDAWIRTVVDHTTQTINIHHKFDDNKNGNTVLDLRQKIKNNGNTKDTADDIDLNDGSNSFNITTPIVDSMGHVVAKNTETVTLPYGFKTISVANESKSTDGVAVTAGDVVADNTQDTLTLTPGNKWIHMSIDEASDDTIIISHEVNSTTSDEATTNWTETESNTTIPVVTYEYDKAGHYTKHHTENYQLPFGYGKIKGDNNTSTAATATYDELSIVTGDNWLTSTVSADTVTITHDFTAQDNTETKANKNNNSDNDNDDNAINKDRGDTLKLYTPIVDEKGHVVGKNTEIVTLPYGYKTFEDSESGDKKGSSSADNTQDTFSFKGDSWVKPVVTRDLLTISHEGPVSVAATKMNDDTPNFGGTFTITDWYFDGKGHKSSSNTHTITIPSLSLNNGTGNVVTGLSLTPASGVFAETKANLGAIKLGTYADDGNSDDLTADITLQQALRRLENKIAKEATNRQTAIEALNIKELLKMVIDLQAQVTALEAKVNEIHPVENTETTE